MPNENISASEEELIDRLVTHYLRNKNLIKRFLDGFHAHMVGAMDESQPLSALVHSVKRRMKDPTHLKDKLIDKLVKKRGAGEPFDISEDNLLLKINDLGGYRILHLHTRQMGEIDHALRELLDVASCDLFEQPFAYIWDDESSAYFEGIGIRTELNPRMYSSVHYVVRPRSKAVVTFEIQVRTLADEIWGEVDHKINYPKPHDSLACREQIKALARVASSCSRLVDAIVASHNDWQERRKADSTQPEPAMALEEGPADEAVPRGQVAELSQPGTCAGSSQGDARLAAIKQRVYAKSNFLGSCLEHMSGFRFEQDEAVFMYDTKDRFFAELLDSREHQQILGWACAEALGRPMKIRVSLEDQ